MYRFQVTKTLSCFIDEVLRDPFQFLYLFLFQVKPPCEFDQAYTQPVYA